VPRGRKRLPATDLDTVLATWPTLRQSLLGDFDSCRLMTLFGLEGTPYTNAAQARGIIFHRFAGEVLRTLRRTGEQQIPVSEALEILYEVARQADVPSAEVVTVPAAERRLLRILAIKFASENRFRMDRLIDVERRLFATVEYPRPDGGVVQRTITGQLDALIADPPDGAVVLDWKTTRQPPPRYTPRREDPHPDHGRGVSYLGYFQQRTYALLVMANYEAVERVTLREFYPLAGEARTATVMRADLEHVARELAGLAEGLDRALAEGGKSPLWHPSPGKHCSYCPRPGSCPIDAEVRMAEGGITSKAQAQRAAAQYVLANRDKDLLHEALQGWVEVHGPVAVRSGKGRYEVRWKKPKTGNGRGTFGVHVPTTSDRGPEDPQLTEAFLEAAQAREGASA
jgi:hypothetical protein